MEGVNVSLWFKEQQMFLWTVCFEGKVVDINDWRAVGNKHVKIKWFMRLSKLLRRSD